jgi:membrane associated rhomboid family serine protease
MGYQDRDYYRGEAPANPLAGSVVIQLIVVNVLVFLVNYLFAHSPGSKTNDWIMNWLELQPGAITRPLQWYQFLTYGFAHDTQGLTHLGFNMLGLYFFGRAIEDRFGWKEFLRFYLVAIVLGGVVWSIRNTVLNTYLVENFGGQPVPMGPLAGASGGVTAVVILFCLYYPRATLLLFFFIPTPAWLAGLLIVLVDMFGAGPDRVAHDVHLTGAAFAAVYWYFGWHFGRMPGMAGIGRMVKAAGKSLQAKPDLRVHDPDPSYDDLDEEGDRLVEKVGREGMESLTPRERDALEAYSRRMRQKHR